jgi:hypothetical protein
LLYSTPRVTYSRVFFTRSKASLMAEKTLHTKLHTTTMSQLDHNFYTTSSHLFTSHIIGWLDIWGYAASVSIVNIVCMLPIPRRHRGGRESGCSLLSLTFLDFFAKTLIFHEDLHLGGKMCTSRTHNRLTWSSLQFYYYWIRRPQRWSVVQFCDFGVIVSTLAGCEVWSSLHMWEDLADFLHVTPERSFRIKHNRD